MVVGDTPIKIVGCGPGAPEYITILARETIEGADLLVGARRLLDLFPDLRAERIEFRNQTGKTLDEIEERMDRYRNIAVLVTGDPGLASLARSVIKRFGREACTTVAGVSSVQVAFARLGLDWTNAKIINAHGRELHIEPSVLAGADRLAILTGGVLPAEKIAELIETFGDRYEIVLCENLTLPDENIRVLQGPGSIPSRVSERAIIILTGKDLTQ